MTLTYSAKVLQFFLPDNPQGGKIEKKNLKQQDNYVNLIRSNT